MRQLFIFLLVPLIFVRFSYAAPATLQYQGRIVKSDRTPLEYSNVSFIFQITSASGSCILFEEQVNGYDMTGTDGVFDMPIGLGTKSFPADPNFTVIDSFSDDVTLSCKGGLTYTPGVNDGRRLRVHFHDGSGWRTILPDNIIRSVPYASYASSAAKLNGLPSSAFIVKTGIPNCAAGTYLSWNGTALSCQAVSGVNNSSLANGSVTSDKILDGTISTADLADGAVTDVKISGVGVNKVNSGVGQYFTYAPNNLACTPGQILKWQNSRWECGNESGVGAEADPTVEAFSKNAPSADFSTPADVLTLNTVPVAKGGTGATTASGALNALLPSQGGQAGKILKTDGTTASWDTAAASGVTSVDVAVPTYMSTSGGAITSSGVITLGFDSQAQNLIFASPIAGAGAPSFRSLQINDITSSAGGAFLTGAACIAGQALVYTSANDTISCQAITASGSAGGDLTGTYPSPAIVAGAVSNGKLAADAVTTDKILDGTIATNDLANLAVTDAKISGVAVSKIASGVGHYFNYFPNGTACTPGQILKWQNSHWECGNESGVGSETDPTVAAFSKNTPSADFSTPADVLTLNTVPVAKGGTGATTAAGALNALLPSQGSNAGKILKTDGTNASWEDAPAIGGAAGGDLTGTYPNPTIAAGAVDVAKLANGSVTNVKIVDVSVNKISSGSTLFFTYSPDGVACGVGQTLKWQNSRWECGNDLGVATETDPTVAAFSKNAPSADFSTPANVLTLNTVPISKGGTGATTAAAAINALVPSQGSNAGKVLQTNGSVVSWETPVTSGGTVTQVSTGTGLTGGPINTTGTVSIAAGGVSATELASNAVTTVKILDNNVTPAKLETVPSLVAGAYGTAAKIPAVTVDTKGRVTAISTNDLNVKIADIKNGLGTAAFNVTGCLANQTVNWSSLLDTFTCQNIGSLDADKITAGTIANARLPASAKMWQDGGSNNIYYNLGSVGIGTNNPQEKFDVKGADRTWARTVNTASTTDENTGFQTVNYMNGRINGPTFWGVNYRGTEAAPAALQANDMLMSVGASGGRDNAWNVNTGAFLIIRAAENYSATAGGTKMGFFTAANGTTVTQERMTVDHNGNVGLGTVSPINKLDIFSTVASDGIRSVNSSALGASSGGLFLTATSNIPSAVDQRLGSFVFGGITNGTNFGYPVGISARTAEAWNASNTGAYLRFETTSAGTNTRLERVRIDADGNVGIGTVSPTYKLDVAGNLRITGTPYRTGGDIAWQVPSDARLKDITGPYEHGLHELLQLNMIRFHYKKNNPVGADTTKEYTGVLAQEVQRVIPEAVDKDPKTSFLSLNTTPIFWAMINAIKDLYGRLLGVEQSIADQSRKIASDGAQIELLKEKNQKLEQENIAKQKELDEVKARLDKIEKMFESR